MWQQDVDEEHTSTHKVSKEFVLPVRMHRKQQSFKNALEEGIWKWWLTLTSLLLNTFKLLGPDFKIWNHLLCVILSPNIFQSVAFATNPSLNKLDSFTPKLFHS